MIPLASSTTKYRDGILKSQHFARPFKSSQETKGKFKSQGILWEFYKHRHLKNFQSQIPKQTRSQPQGRDIQKKLRTFNVKILIGC